MFMFFLVLDLLHFFLKQSTIFLYILFAWSDLHIAAIDIAMAAISLSNFFIDCCGVM